MFTNTEETRFTVLMVLIGIEAVTKWLGLMMERHH